MSSETVDDPRLALERADAEAAIRAFVAYAQSKLQKLVDGTSDGRARLVSGPEGGEITETVLGRVMSELGVDELRATEAKPPRQSDDPDTEVVFEAPTDTGLILRLGRIRDEDGTAWLELDAERSNAIHSTQTGITAR